MALSDNQRESIASWFDQSTKEAEHEWVGELVKVTPFYEEHGFTKGEGAILFMLSHLLMQMSKMHGILREWEDDASED